MITAKNCVVWVNKDNKLVRVVERGSSAERQILDDRANWGDPIGAAYSQWLKMTDSQRAVLMTETALDLAMQGHDLASVLREFAKVDCFHKLGRDSFPMCRALTSAIVGQCLEPNTMTFDELLVAYPMPVTTPRPGGGA
jgi:hypothetical protein